MKSVSVYSWQPEGSSNFGDVIGPMIVSRLLREARIEAQVISVGSGQGKVLAVGSILQAAAEGDVVWGSGVNGKTWLPARIGKLALSIRGVRGPISKLALNSVGHDCPEVYGDPGLLFPLLYHNEIMIAARRLTEYYRVVRGGLPSTVFLANLNDERFYFPEADLIPPEWEIINTFSDPITVAAQIMLAERVVSSSLHGIVFGDILAKEVCYVASRFEPQLKYDDYFLGTGRDPVTPYNHVKDGIAGNVPKYNHDMSPMLNAFPLDAVFDRQEQPILDVEGQNRLKVLDASSLEPDGLGTSLFQLGAVCANEGWENPTGQEAPKYLWAEKVAYLKIDRELIASLEYLTIFISKTAGNVRLEKVRAAIDGSRYEVEAVQKGGSDYLKIALGNKLSREGKSRTCLIKVNFGEDATATDAFGSSMLPGRRFSAQVRKIGATFKDKRMTLSGSSIYTL